MSQSYVKTCTFCKKEIKMSEEGGKWHPYNKDGSPHDCKKKNGNGTQVTLEAVLKKLQSIGVTVNMEELMKQ
jgi:hypothetical protein